MGRGNGKLGMGKQAGRDARFVFPAIKHCETIFVSIQPVEQGFIIEKGGENLFDVLADAMIADEEFMAVCAEALEIATAELNKGN